MVFSSSHKSTPISASTQKSSLRRRFRIVNKGAIALGLFAGLAAVSVPNVSEAAPRKVTARSLLRKATNAVVHGKTRTLRAVRLGKCLKITSGGLEYQAPHMRNGAKMRKIVSGMASCNPQAKLTASVAKTFRAKVSLVNGRRKLTVLEQGRQARFGRADDALGLIDNLDGILADLVGDLDLGAVGSEGLVTIGAAVDTLNPDTLQIGLDDSGLLSTEDVVSLDSLGDLESALSSLDVPLEITTIADGDPLAASIDGTATDPFDEVSDTSTSNDAPVVCPS